MTESEWWSATDTDSLIDWLFFDCHATDRKLRLFAVAGCASLRPLVGDPGILAALDSTEAFADGHIDVNALEAIHIAAWTNLRARYDRNFPAGAKNAEIVCLYPTAQDPHRDRDRYNSEDDWPYALLVTRFIDHPNRAKPSSPRLVRLLHDIFGPLPFRDVGVSPSWLTSDVLALARGIYEEKAFDRMPILADALQDAGCDNDEMLNHCRAEGWEHVRGCWVIDLLLGRPWREKR
jgi:hypothetical protein